MTKVRGIASATLWLGVLASIVSIASADSIDEAEAKRRGVPVSQVQAENALNAEKRKTADLTNQVAALEKQLAELRGQQTGTGSPAPATSGSAVARVSSPVYDKLVARYLAGDWDTLATDIAARQKEIAALPQGNRDDLTYISGALAECRPAWWQAAESNPHTVFDAKILNATVHVDYSVDVIRADAGMVKGQLTLVASWAGPDMDDPTPVTLQQMQIDVPGDFGFHRADAIDFQVWNVLGIAAPRFELSPDAWKAGMSTPEGKLSANHYLGFWSIVSPAYYLSPSARRLLCATAFVALGHDYDNKGTWPSRRALASMLLVEFISHRDQYPSLKIDEILGAAKLPTDKANGEKAIADVVLKSVLQNRLSLAEDRRLRDAVKAFALANDPWDPQKDFVTLPNKMIRELDESADVPKAAERCAWIKAQFTPK